MNLLCYALALAVFIAAFIASDSAGRRKIARVAIPTIIVVLLAELVFFT